MSYVLLKVEDFKRIKDIIDSVDPSVYSEDYEETFIYIKISYNIQKYIHSKEKQAHYIEKLINIFNLFNKYYICFIDDVKNFENISKVYDIFDLFKEKLNTLAKTSNDFVNDIDSILDISFYKSKLKSLNNTKCDEILNIKKELMPTYFDQMKFKMINMLYQTGTYMPTSICSVLTILRLLSKFLCDSIDTITNKSMKDLFLFLGIDLNFKYEVNVLIYILKLMCKFNLRNLNLLVSVSQSKKLTNMKNNIKNEIIIQEIEEIIEEEKVNNNDNNDKDKEEKKKVKNISQHVSSFIYIFRNIKVFMTEKVTEFVTNLEMSPQGQALLLLSLVSILKSVKIDGWRTIGKYYDYKVDKLLGQPKKGRAPNPPKIAIQMNRRMLLTNCGLLLYAYNREISAGLKDLLDIEIEKDPDAEDLPIVFGGGNDIKKIFTEYDNLDILKQIINKSKSIQQY